MDRVPLYELLRKKKANPGSEDEEKLSSAELGKTLKEGVELVSSAKAFSEAIGKNNMSVKELFQEVNETAKELTKEEREARQKTEEKLEELREQIEQEREERHREEIASMAQAATEAKELRERLHQTEIEKVRTELTAQLQGIKEKLEEAVAKGDFATFRKQYQEFRELEREFGSKGERIGVEGEIPLRPKSWLDEMAEFRDKIDKAKTLLRAIFGEENKNIPTIGDLPADIALEVYKADLEDKRERERMRRQQELEDKKTKAWSEIGTSLVAGASAALDALRGEEEEERPRRRRHNPNPELLRVECDQCGEDFYIAQGKDPTRCPFCGSE